MVFSQISKNFSNSVKSKPPLVVFTVCLLGIILTTFCLAYYVDSQDRIPNVDAKDDWLSLLKHLNTLDVCIENTNGPVFKNTNKKDKTKTVSVVSYMKASELSAKQDLNVQGFLPLEGWSSKCSDTVKIPTHLEIAFKLLKTDQNNTNNENVCVTLTGPTDFMPKILEQASCGSGSKSNKKKWAKLTTKPNNDVDKDFCISGSIGKVQHDLDYTKNLNFDVFLSRADRLMINSHLIVISCFLLFVVVLITCYALVKSRNNGAGGGDSKQHLMSKGMYL